MELTTSQDKKLYHYHYYYCCYYCQEEIKDRGINPPNERFPIQAKPYQVTFGSVLLSK